MITSEFSLAIYGYLEEQGYNHLLLKGIQPVTQLNERHYYIEPLMPDDPRIAEFEDDGLIARMDYYETMSVLAEEPFMKIMIQWPVELYSAYLRAIS